MGAKRSTLLAVVLFGAACAGDAPEASPSPTGAGPATAASPTGDPELWRSDPDEPYPFATPIPPVAETPIDGTYTRNVETARPPIPCRRCAPYRVDRGPATLQLENGRFHLEQPASAFLASGHFLVEGDHIVLFNDAVCPEIRGTYRWSLDGDALTFEIVQDTCAFDLLRTRYFTAEPWVRSDV